MFSGEMLTGIILASGKFFVSIKVEEKMRIGYSTKMGMDIRMDSYEFLETVHRSFQALGIKTIIKKKEGKHRPRPILRIRGAETLNTVRALIVFNSARSLNHDESLGTFFKMLDIILKKGHRTLEGIEQILILKGELDGSNNNE
jgi:hypothetical protein|tara:strand:- start:2958 stop:3389 length:432 start_codon:yes stop_codon:yes gene_type:complete